MLNFLFLSKNLQLTALKIFEKSFCYPWWTKGNHLSAF